MLHRIEHFTGERDGVAHFCVAQIKQHIDTFRVAQEHFANLARAVDQPAVVADQLKIEQLIAAAEGQFVGPRIGSVQDTKTIQARGRFKVGLGSIVDQHLRT